MDGHSGIDGKKGELSKTFQTLGKLRKPAIHVVVAFAAFLFAFEWPTAKSFDWWLHDGKAIVVLQYAVAFAALAAIFEALFRVERSSWRFVSIADAIKLVRSTVATAIVFLVLAFFLDRARILPRSTFALMWTFHTGGLMGLRILRRALYEGSLTRALIPVISPAEPRPFLLIAGELSQAEGVVRELTRGVPSHGPVFQPVALVGPSSQDKGQVIRGVPVMGSVDELQDVLEQLRESGQAPAAILFLEGAHVDGLPKGLVGKLRADGVRLLRLPKISELGHEDAGGLSIRDLSLEELLSRPPVKLDLALSRALVNGRRVLVTGAGGSIGSEICRQVALLGCARLSLLDSSEFALFGIDEEIGRAHPQLPRQEILCDVRDRAAVRGWIARERPDIIFHAAALKHVPLVENHPGEGVQTNVLGTWNVAEAARREEVDQVVLISTDKAVDPCNVMGATKRLAEAVVRSHHGGTTRFSIVRFGNVLGSNGSVVPTFAAQIERGGPVTVTHEDVERFFMTIPEAVQLVLHASAMGASSQTERPRLFVLEMGQPVRIYDLARQMIELAGKAPGVDIPIQITGLRPGEKITEHLVDNSETSVACGAGVMEVINYNAMDRLTAQEVRDLGGLSGLGDAERLHAEVFRLVDIVRGRRERDGVLQLWPSGARREPEDLDLDDWVPAASQLPAE